MLRICNPDVTDITGIPVYIVMEQKSTCCGTTRNVERAPRWPVYVPPLCKIFLFETRNLQRRVSTRITRASIVRKLYLSSNFDELFEILCCTKKSKRRTCVFETRWEIIEEVKVFDN